MPAGTKPLRGLTAPNAPLPPDIALAGPAVPKLERLRHMNSQSWEDFVLEWAHSLSSKYARTEQCGGAGDMGRDILGFESATESDPWDNFQCKHYDHRLAPSDIWIELGKLAYYTFIGEYSLPRHYRFVAPQGAGNTLSSLLRRPAELRDGLIAAWPKSCQKQITSTKEVVLTGALQKHLEGIDFSIFGLVAPLTLIDDHAKTQWHTARFGGGLPTRQHAPNPPTEVASGEANYIRALLDAYEDRIGNQLPEPSAIGDAGLTRHFSRSRREFYSAESLREFSRDNVPPGTFESFLDEIHDGIDDVVQANHQDPFERVLAVVKQAKTLHLTANALVSRTTTTDRGGMCHQLANDLRIRWRR